MRRMKWTAAALALGVFSLAACEPAADEGAVQQEPAAQEPAAQEPTAQQPAGQVPEGATAEMVAQGQQLFNGQGICFTCHGTNGQGGQLAPNLTDNEWLWIDPAAGDVMTQVATLIETGVAQPQEYPAPMPPMAGVQLSDEQIQALAAYVISISGAGAS